MTYEPAYPVSDDHWWGYDCTCPMCMPELHRRRVRIAKPQRVVTWILVMPLATALFLVVLIVAFMVYLVVPFRRLNRSMAPVCANCTWLQDQHYKAFGHEERVTCYNGRTRWRPSESVVSWSGGYFPAKVGL